MSTELSIAVKGDVPGSIKREVTHTLEDCYRRFSPKVPQMVEVQLVDKPAVMRDFLKEEKMKLGITTSGEEGFICTHDAWRNFPRLIICSERLAGLGKLARLGAIRHEAAHTALHGSLEYYVFRVPENCWHTAKIKGIDLVTLEQAVYYMSVAVKDFEATRFLAAHDFIKCQVAFVLEALRPSEEDKLMWQSAKTNRRTRFLYRVALLKPILFAHPLLSAAKSKKLPLEQQVQLGRRMEVLVEHMGRTAQEEMFQLANTIAEKLTEDTHSNIDMALYQAMALA